jgi:hypothetical protein
MHFHFSPGLDLSPLTSLLDAVWELPLEGDLDKRGTGRFKIAHGWQTRHFKLDAPNKKLVYKSKTGADTAIGLKDVTHNLPSLTRVHCHTHSYTATHTHTRTLWFHSPL